MTREFVAAHERLDGLRMFRGRLASREIGPGMPSAAKQV